MRVVVVGGGIAGLAAGYRARELAGPTAQVLVLERSGALGGKLRTGRILELPVDTGAEAFLTDGPDGRPSAATRLAHRVGLAGAIRHPSPAPAALALDGVLRTVPGGTLVGVPGELSTLDGVAEPTAAADRDGGRPLVQPGEDPAVGALVRRRLGDQVVDRLVDPMLGGVYAGRADELSLAATMPALYAAALTEHTLVGAVRTAQAGHARRAGAPVFSTVDGGLTRLVQAVALEADLTVRCGATVRGLRRDGTGWQVLVGPATGPEAIPADAVVLALPAAPAARLLAGVCAPAAQALRELDYASVALVTLALPAGLPLPALSGFLVPDSDRYQVKAVTFIGTKWPHLRREDGVLLVRASMGRHRGSDVLQHTDAALVELALADLAGLLGIPVPAPLASLVSRWGGALPQYAPGHLDRVAAARAALPPTLAIAGAATDGIGIPACVRSGEAAASAVLTGRAEWVA